MKKLIVIIPVILLISLSVYIGITYFNIGKYDEYYINNSKVRLKDITTLFLDSGMGVDSFNIISQ